ncbi:hypothetical protein RZS08_10980, partial [Arthrospira platensis SPKY1]|nr:hypothetical protein [Arthrospira platensis SPKY1]
LPALEERQPAAIRFFGAGVVGPHIERLQQLFQLTFGCHDVICGSDLLGASLALFGQESGIACILGTGSNSCVMEGGQIVDQIPTLGFILGDEGSAGWIGRQLLRHHFYRSLPADLQGPFAAIAPDRIELLTLMRQDPYFNRHIAGSAAFVGQHAEHPFIVELIRSSIREFLQFHVLPYGEDRVKALTLGFVGTVARCPTRTFRGRTPAHRRHTGSGFARP